MYPYYVKISNQVDLSNVTDGPVNVSIKLFKHDGTLMVEKVSIKHLPMDSTTQLSLP